MSCDFGLLFSASGSKCFLQPRHVPTADQEVLAALSLGGLFSMVSTTFKNLLETREATDTPPVAKRANLPMVETLETFRKTSLEPLFDRKRHPTNKKRQRLDNYQKVIMMTFIKNKKYASKEDALQLSRDTGLSYRQVLIWLQNRRGRDKNRGSVKGKTTRKTNGTLWVSVSKPPPPAQGGRQRKDQDLGRDHQWQHCGQDVWCRGGKMQTVNRKITAPKSSKTTDQQHAVVVAERDWLSQLDKGYVVRMEELDSKQKEACKHLLSLKQESGGNNHSLLENRKRPVQDSATSTKTILPNLAGTYAFTQACRKYFDYDDGVYLQPKLDGQRCLAWVEGDNVFLTTRKGKQWKWLDHIRKDVKEMLGDTGHILDGELYAHDVCNVSGEIERFGFLSSCCKTSRTKPHPQEHLVQYHVFDIATADQTMSQPIRFAVLDRLWSDYHGDVIQRVKTTVVHSEIEAQNGYSKCMLEGYEGIILRDKSLTYKSGRRDTRMRKLKEFYDDDFAIVGAEEAQGTQEGCVVWICENQNHNTFRCVMEGSIEFRQSMYQNRKRQIGKLLKVRHQTPPEEIQNGVVPRFPVGLGIRQD